MKTDKKDKTAEEILLEKEEEARAKAIKLRQEETDKDNAKLEVESEAHLKRHKILNEDKKE